PLSFDRGDNVPQNFNHRDVDWQFDSAGNSNWKPAPDGWHFTLNNPAESNGTLFNASNGDVVRFGDGSSPNRHTSTFDAWGRLVADSMQKATSPGIFSSTAITWAQRGQAAYEYDALGRRIKENGLDLYYGGDGNVVEEILSGTVQARYIRSPDGQLAV